MKVAVSALEPTIDARVDERFGRAMHLVFVDTDTLEFDFLDNAANRNALQGSGIGAAEAVAEAGCSAVITGHLGPKAYKALQAVGVPGYAGAGMTVREAVAAFKEGRLQELAEGEAHAGM